MELNQALKKVSKTLLERYKTLCADSTHNFMITVQCLPTIQMLIREDSKKYFYKKPFKGDVFGFKFMNKYHEYVISLKTIRNKLQRRLYASVSAVISDVEHLFTSTMLSLEDKNSDFYFYTSNLYEKVHLFVLTIKDRERTMYCRTLRDIPYIDTKLELDSFLSESTNVDGGSKEIDELVNRVDQLKEEFSQLKTFANDMEKRMKKEKKRLKKESEENGGGGQKKKEKIEKEEEEEEEGSTTTTTTRKRNYSNKQKTKLFNAFQALRDDDKQYIYDMLQSKAVNKNGELTIVFDKLQKDVLFRIDQYIKRITLERKERKKAGRPRKHKVSE